MISDSWSSLALLAIASLAIGAWLHYLATALHAPRRRR